MTLTHALPLEVHRRAQSLDAVDNRRLRRAIESGEWYRIAPGSFVLAQEWRRLLPMQRHRVRVLEVLRRLPSSVVISHAAAAALWGIDVLGDWPDRVDTTIDRRSGGRSSGIVRRRVLGLDDVARIPFGRHEITTPAQTALDLARTLPFVRGVSAVDQARWLGRPGGALATFEDIHRLLAASTGHRGDARAGLALAASADLAANARESQSRVVIAQLGFPEPRLQERRVLPDGTEVHGDFYFPQFDHWGELDGNGKYLDAAMRNGRSVAEVVMAEKRRENAIRRLVTGFSRWEPADVDDPRRLYDIPTRDGLPSRLPRP